MQWRPTVGGVEGDAPPARLGVDRTAGRHERRDIGDGVPDHVAAAGSGLDVQRLVEIGAAGRIDGDERQVAAIDPGVVDHRRRRASLVEDLGREGVGHVELGPDGSQPFGDERVVEGQVATWKRHGDRR